MTLTQAVARVCSRLNKNSNDTTVSTRIKNHINDACLEKWQAYEWGFRHREYPLVLSPRVATGTMTATNASQTVTASGTPFIVGTHEGAWIRFTADTVQAWYRVRTVSSTSVVTIEPAYQGTTGSSKAYELIKIDYLLPLELSDTAMVTMTALNTSIPVRHQNYTDAVGFPPQGSGVPSSATIFTQSAPLSSYTTGTVSGTSGTTTLTGVGTSWLTNVSPGDQITINGDTNVYTVHAVNSDTSIVLYNFLSSSPSGATYTSDRQFGKVIRFSNAPDQPYVVFIKGLRRYWNMTNNSDSNELLHRYPHAVIESAIWREAGSSPDPREDSLYQKSEMLWARAQGEDEQLFPLNNPNPIWNPRATDMRRWH